ncbi:MAG TPA: MarR family transcriptional regulator [Cytophagales bacterium]|nr:MarR family transcriptional regulator [Cytophagales bacterium]HAA24107.1 MarR family transcriptional regulator [Cytophagales bacterium]HAP57973.1 MarR family transcriptional regulator [Cytophagales bacterium]
MDIEDKIIRGIERLADVFKSLLWEQAKQVGISPIQIQILLFVAQHKREMCSVTLLAREFHLTKPTVSDAVKSLHSKGYLEKDYSPEDSRSYLLFLTPKGESLAQELAGYAQPVKQVLAQSNGPALEDLYTSLTGVIYQLNQAGVIQAQRTCYGCQFYSKQEGQHYCAFLQKPLLDTEIRLDCGDFQEKM